ARGEVDRELSSQPFPSRRFLYAFEAAAAFETAQGHPVDFRPMQEPQSSLARFLDIDRIVDPSIGPAILTVPGHRTNATLLSNPVDPRFFRAGTLRVEMGKWGYRWQFDGTGTVVQRAWRHGLMRLWTTTGRLEKRGGEICLHFLAATSVCFASLYAQGDWILAFDADG